MHEAIALCPTGVPVVGAACGAVTGAVSGVAGKVAGAGANAVFAAAATWVASGAVWLLQGVGRVMSATTTVDLGAPWFAAHEAVMASLAAVVVLPMVCCAVIQAVYRQSASNLLRTFTVYLPLCLLFTGVAVTMVRMALSVTDALSGRVLAGAGVDTADMFSGLTKFFVAGSAGGPAVPAFVVFIGALVVALGALVLWLELAVRAAAVSAAVLFLPLALAALVWPAVAHWCRRLADTLTALILSKFVIAAVLSLAASALSSGLGFSPDGGGFAAVVTGTALLLVATLSPFTLLRLVPAVEAGAASHLESARHRLHGAARSAVRGGGNLALDLARGNGSSSGQLDVAPGSAPAPDGSGSIPMVTGLALAPEAAAPMAVASAASSPHSGGAGGSGPATTDTPSTASPTAARSAGPAPSATEPRAADGALAPQVVAPAGSSGPGRSGRARDRLIDSDEGDDEGEQP
jgi:hypothetical protein